MSKRMKSKLSYGPAFAGVLIGASLFSMTNVSCGEVQSACAADCPADVETRLGDIEDRLATFAELEGRIATLTSQVDQLSQEVASARQTCATGRVLRWNGSAWECENPIWTAAFSRIDATTIWYKLPDGTEETLAIGDGTMPATGTLLAYRPGSNGDAVLYFNLKTAPSIACTLLHAEDDVLRIGAYFATDSGNGYATVWGNSSTPTFMFAREGMATFVTGVNESYSIACF